MIINSDNFKLSENGTITATNGTFSGKFVTTDQRVSSNGYTLIEYGNISIYDYNGFLRYQLGFAYNGLKLTDNTNNICTVTNRVLSYRNGTYFTACGAGYLYITQDLIKQTRIEYDRVKTRYLGVGEYAWNSSSPNMTADGTYYELEKYYLCSDNGAYFRNESGNDAIFCNGNATYVNGITYFGTGTANSSTTGDYIINNKVVIFTSDNDYNKLYVNGNLTVENGIINAFNESGVEAQINVKNSLRSGRLVASVSGNLGIYDETNSIWLFTSDPRGSSYVKAFGPYVYLDANNSVRCIHLNFDSLIPIVASAFSTTSSKRYKENINFFEENDSQIIYNLIPVSFDYKYNFSKKTKHQLGLIAEDVYEQFPQCVVLDSEGQPDGIDYSKIVPLLIDAVQKQKKEIDELKSLLNIHDDIDN